MCRPIASKALRYECLLEMTLDTDLKIQTLKVCSDELLKQNKS